MRPMTKGTITIHAKEQGAALGDLFGIFFEDLNHAADGGLYAELVQNRSFEFDPIDHPDYHALTAWDKVERGGGTCELRVESDDPLNGRNVHYAVIDISSDGDDVGVGLMNHGFNTGIPIKEGNSYVFSMYARRTESFEQPVRIALEGQDGRVCAEEQFTVTTDEWTRYETKLTANATDYGGRLVLTAKGSGTLGFDMISLFPARTFRGRSNGLRQDIAEMIAELKPKFMRFPGGCLIHDGSLDPDDRNSMYRWKNTIGDIAERPSRRNNWRYNQTLGLGYFEYFLFCEDIGAKPIPILPAGYDPHHKRIVPLDELQPWIDDALDLIEFANGDVSTEWGGLRASLGHPEPFGMEYIGIGNEEVGEPFFERYAYIHRAIKSKHPEMKVINSSGPFSAGSEYERGWRSARENRSDLVDEHYYQAPEWLLAHHRRYDSFQAGDPKVFLGEYASWGNTYYNALAEAAFMTGLERNAHAVGLACYAPMLCNTDYVNWKPDMIWFDNHQVFGTANYYVQKLFMHHQGDYVLRVDAEGFDTPAGAEVLPIAGKLAIVSNQANSEFSDITLTDHVTGKARKLAEDTVYLSDTAEDNESGTARRMAELGSIDSEHYTLTMKARRTSGSKGFIIHFGETDEQNRIFWEIGGWQNQDSLINAFVKGRSSVLTQSLFAVETDVDYLLELEVHGRRIRASINGELVADTEDTLPVIEPLYVASSMEETTGDIILKVVNMQPKQVDARILLEESGRDGFDVEIAELSGHTLEAENGFEEPEKIVPAHRTARIAGNGLEYVFPQHSLTVFRIKNTI